MNNFKSYTAILFVILLMLALAGCDSALSGTYTSDGSAPFGNVIKSMTFKPGGRVEVLAMGVTRELPYEREGKKIKITDERNVATIFTIDDNGCLDGGEMIGKFCKN
jgi:hypothetical protein